MSFTFSSSALTPYGSPPSIHTYTKSIESNAIDRIDELQKFLLGSDWSSLSSLSPSTAPIRAIVDDLTQNHYPSSFDTVKPTLQSVSVVSSINMSDHIAPLESPAPYESALTPPNRNSFDTCYSDSVGSPDSERDFLTSPSLFDNAAFEFEADNNFPLFPDQLYDDSTDAHADNITSNIAYNLENVKLESEHQDSQFTQSDLGASQSTVVPFRSQVKIEEDTCESHSTLEAAFKTESELVKLEPKYEHDVWSTQDLKPYFGDQDTKSAVLSTLANAFGHNPAESAKKTLPREAVVDVDEQQVISQAGPIRSSRANRERGASPTKAAASASASPAPTYIDPVSHIKRWQCQDCGKWFNRAFNLSTHRITHQDPETRARPFTCPDEDCGKAFARKHDMQRHLENVHRGGSRRIRGGSNKRSRPDDLG